jgi:TldD protein
MDYQRLLSRYTYAEVRIEKSFDSSISIKDEEVKHSSGNSEGISVRVLEKGSWGFASSSRNEDIEGLLKKAESLARLGKGSIGLDIPKAEKRGISKPVEASDTEEQVKFLLEASREMKAKRISSRNISCTDSRDRVEFHNSEGAEIIQETGFTYLSCSSIAREGDLIQRGATRAWSRSGFGRIDVLGTAGKSKDKALRLLDALPPPKGRFTVVLDHEMTGVFSHEAIGHACEADSVLDRESVLADKRGKQIGNSLVNIVDDPSADDFGHYVYDDEGVKGKKTVLVEGGILRQFMNSMETAKKLGIEPNGHARAEDYSAVPIVRMSNTYFLSGESSPDDVFDIRSGIYLKGMKGGSVDIFSGGFMFKAEEAYSIKNGEKQDIMRDVTITGNILQTLLDVECVGRDFGSSPGLCGKFSQAVPVSDGGPHIRVKNVTIG